MFSPKKYLEEFIATQLNSFVSSVDESNLSVQDGVVVYIAYQF